MGQKHGVDSTSRGKGREFHCWGIGKTHCVDSRGKGKSKGVSGLSSIGKKYSVDSRVECGAEMFLLPSPFNDFPEECFSNIFSFTSPRDACVAASVSKTFKSVVDSDTIWDKFLPPEYASLIPGSRVFSSKKELYFALCDHFLIEDGIKSFWLEKASGKKCIMLSAMDLSVPFEDDELNAHQNWKWYPIPESRFEEVGEVVCTFQIHGSMDSSILSPRTLYSAYVVFKNWIIFWALKTTQ